MADCGPEVVRSGSRLGGCRGLREYFDASLALGVELERAREEASGKQAGQLDAHVLRRLLRH